MPYFSQLPIAAPVNSAPPYTFVQRGNHLELKGVPNTTVSSSADSSSNVLNRSTAAVVGNSHNTKIQTTTRSSRNNAGGSGITLRSNP